MDVPPALSTGMSVDDFVRKHARVMGKHAHPSFHKNDRNGNNVLDKIEYMAFVRKEIMFLESRSDKISGSGLPGMRDEHSKSHLATERQQLEYLDQLQDEMLQSRTRASAKLTPSLENINVLSQEGDPLIRRLHDAEKLSREYNAKMELKARESRNQNKDL